MGAMLDGLLANDSDLGEHDRWAIAQSMASLLHLGQQAMLAEHAEQQARRRDWLTDIPVPPPPRDGLGHEAHSLRAGLRAMGTSDASQSGPSRA